MPISGDGLEVFFFCCWLAEIEELLLGDAWIFIVDGLLLDLTFVNVFESMTSQLLWRLGGI